MIFAPSAACYLYYSQYFPPQNKRVVKKTTEAGTLLNEQASYTNCRWVTMLKNILTPLCVGLWR